MIEMGILDKLMEKKDLLCYIRARKSILKKRMIELAKSDPPQKRELKIRLVEGRLKELSLLGHLVRMRKIKEWSITNWKAAMDAERWLDNEEE